MVSAPSLARNTINDTIQEDQIIYGLGNENQMQRNSKDCLELTIPMFLYRKVHGGYMRKAVRLSKVVVTKIRHLGR